MFLDTKKLGKIWLYSVLFFVFLVISFISYKQLFQHGFIFEEWQKYGETRVLNSVITSEFFLSSLPSLFLGKGRALGSLIYNYLILTYGNVATPYAIVGIVSHTLNAFILFFITEKLFRIKIISIISAIFFLTIPISSEALFYFAAPVQTMFSLTFFLLSLYLLLIFLETKRYIFLISSGIFIYVSILFKESGVFFVPVLIIIVLKSFLQNKKKSVYYGTILIFIILTAIGGFIGLSKYSEMYRSLYGFGGFTITKTLANVLIYPIITISHFVVPERFFTRLGTNYIMSNYPNLGWIPPYVYDFIYSSFAVDIISLFFAIPIILFLFYGFLHTKQKVLYIFFISLYWLSFIPIAIVQQERSTGFLERRYYYGVNPLFILLICSGIVSLLKRLSVILKWKILLPVIYLSLLLFFSLLILKNITVIHREMVDQLAKSAKMRTQTMSIMSAHPSLPEKPIFFIENGQDLFPNYGTGYMLALLYADTQKIPKDLLLYTNVDSPLFYAKNIWRKDFEGYLSDTNRGIGFFFKKSSLQEFLLNNPNMSEQQLVGYSINDGKHIQPLSEQQMFDIIHQ